MSGAGGDGARHDGAALRQRRRLTDEQRRILGGNHDRCSAHDDGQCDRTHNECKGLQLVVHGNLRGASMRIDKTSARGGLRRSRSRRGPYSTRRERQSHARAPERRIRARASGCSRSPSSADASAGASAGGTSTPASCPGRAPCGLRRRRWRRSGDRRTSPRAARAAALRRATAARTGRRRARTAATSDRRPSRCTRSPMPCVRARAAKRAFRVAAPANRELQPRDDARPAARSRRSAWTMALDRIQVPDRHHQPIAGSEPQLLPHRGSVRRHRRERRSGSS